MAGFHLLSFAIIRILCVRDFLILALDTWDVGVETPSSPSRVFSSQPVSGKKQKTPSSSSHESSDTVVLFQIFTTEAITLVTMHVMPLGSLLKLLGTTTLQDVRLMGTRRMLSHSWDRRLICISEINMTRGFIMRNLIKGNLHNSWALFRSFIKSYNHMPQVSSSESGMQALKSTKTWNPKVSTSTST